MKKKEEKKRKKKKQKNMKKKKRMKKKKGKYLIHQKQIIPIETVARFVHIYTTQKLFLTILTFETVLTN